MVLLRPCFDITIGHMNITWLWQANSSLMDVLNLHFNTKVWKLFFFFFWLHMNSWAFGVPKDRFYILYIVMIILTIFTANQLMWKNPTAPCGILWNIG